MAITTTDQLLAAMGNNAQHLVINKASLANQLAGGFTSLWRATGTPGQGAIPGAAAIVSALVGAPAITNATGGQTNYLGRTFLVSSGLNTDVQIHDRLAHRGNLVGNITTAQTVGIDLSVPALDGRRGTSDYGDCQVWLEWYTDTGSTAVTATVNVTYDNEASENCLVPLAPTMRAGRMLAVLPATAGRKIKTINTVTLSATTGTAGNFGVTVTRAITSVSLEAANQGKVAPWDMLGLPQIPVDACLMIIVIPGTTTSGTLYGSGKVVAG